MKIPRKYYEAQKEEEKKKKHWETSVIVFAITDAQTKTDLQKLEGSVEKLLGGTSFILMQLQIPNSKYMFGSSQNRLRLLFAAFPCSYLGYCNVMVLTKPVQIIAMGSLILHTNITKHLKNMCDNIRTFDIWYVASSCRPLPRLLKLCSGFACVT